MLLDRPLPALLAHAVLITWRSARIHARKQAGPAQYDRARVQRRLRL